MNIHHVDNLVKQLFIYADNKQWELLEIIFADNCVLETQLLTGKPYLKVTPTEGVQLFKEFLSGFDCTHHQVGNMITKLKGNKAHVFSYATATYYIKDCEQNVWTVVGTYEFDVIEVEKILKIERIAFNFKYQDGNLKLRPLAMTRSTASI